MLSNQGQKRYSGAMATIQVRNVPEDVHRVYRLRAAAAGQSLQEYVLAELIESASTATPAEIVAEFEKRTAAEGTDGLSASSSGDVVRQDRASH